MRNNSFGALRLLAALLVVYTHSFPLALGSAFHEPDIGLPFSLGTTGVFIFFAISGILVTKSFMQSQNVTHFLVHRAVRIFPALLVCLMVCAFVLGPLVTQMPTGQYFLDSHVWGFLLRNILLIGNVQSWLPGVFVSNPLPSALIDPIWTLPWEIRAYVLLAIGGVLLFIKRNPSAMVVLLLLIALNAVFLMDVSKPSLFLVVFFLGGALYLSKLSFPLVLVLAMAMSGICAATHGTPMFEVFFCGWIAVVTYLVGFSRLGKSSFLEKYDLSYGIYIYSFPVGQSMVLVLGMADPWLLFILNAAAAAALAALSWKYIEKPMLDRKHEIAQKVSARFTRGTLTEGT